ncbi:MAG: hypothetical protein FWE33_06500 [Defluviitaleaceae bacterium]|nr:hypothetical protein [Defluviitaleaceae bacterium]
MQKISGKTQVSGLIGGNTANSLSPYIHNFLAHKLGVDMVYTCFNVTKTDLQAAINGALALGIAGLNITAPHKISVIKDLKRLDETANQVQAVNLIKRSNNGFIGYNTDVYGVLCALRHYGLYDIKSATIFGAGGAARSAKVALFQMGCKKVEIIHRQPLDTAIGDLLINATPVSILPSDNFNFFFDMNYPKEYEHKNFFDGKTMLIFQAIKAFEILWDVKITQAIADELILKLKGE